jgi:hypothetical protein
VIKKYPAFFEGRVFKIPSSKISAAFSASPDRIKGHMLKRILAPPAGFVYTRADGRDGEKTLGSAQTRQRARPLESLRKKYKN